LARDGGKSPSRNNWGQTDDPEQGHEQGNWASRTVNGTATARTHDQQNRTTTVGAAALAYDNAGSMTRDESGQTLEYDAWGRLARVRNSGGGVIATNSYDGLGRRITEVRAGITELYYSASWQVLEERATEAGPAKVQYLWGMGSPDALVLRWRDVDGNTANGLEERLYAQQDANGNVTSLVSPGGAVAQRFVYTPYGAVALYDNSWAVVSGNPKAWTYLYQGGRLDATTGLYNFRNRDYRPTLGRFVQQDPLGFGGGDTNLYQFVGNNPATLADPYGLETPSRQRIMRESSGLPVQPPQTGVTNLLWLELQLLRRYNRLPDTPANSSGSATVIPPTPTLNNPEAEMEQNIWLTDYQARHASDSDPNATAQGLSPADVALIQEREAFYTLFRLGNAVHNFSLVFGGALASTGGGSGPTTNMPGQGSGYQWGAQTTTCPTSGGGGRDIALGLTHHGTDPRPSGSYPNPRDALEVFGRNRNAYNYRYWQREGLSRLSPDFGLEQAFNEATANARHIHFNLDGFNLQRGWRQGQGQGVDPLAVGVTNWEFVRVLSNPTLRSITTFWQNGRPVSLSRVLERAGAPTNGLP
jgi:RHS repeat-associated protein